jgi:hypothetical protein
MENNVTSCQTKMESNVTSCPTKKKTIVFMIINVKLPDFNDGHIKE